MAILKRLTSCPRKPSVLTALEILGLLLVLTTFGCSSSDDGKDGDKESKTATTAEDPINDAPLPRDQPVRSVPRAPRDDDWFEDLTDKTGIRFAYQDGSNAGFYTLLESVGGGAALFDYDLDGDMDLFVTGGGDFEGPPINIKGASSALFRNDGDWKFTDVTKDAGLDASDLYTHGVTVGDFDRDGFPDLVVTGYGGCRLYRNENGERFADVTEKSGVACPSWNTAAAWSDYDNDGWLDLYVATYCRWTPGHTRKCIQRTESGRIRDVCAPNMFVGDKDFLWRNRGDGTFEDVTDKCGLTARHRGLGVIAADLDEDGKPDFYVANDVDENDLYYGKTNLEFESYGVMAGVALSPQGDPEGSMGLDFGDVDGDGDPDLFYANFIVQDNSLLKRIQPRTYANVTDIYGLLHVSRKWVGFGAALTDFDNDGWQDLVVANGHVLYGAINGPYFQPAQLFRNEEGKRYTEITEVGGPYFSVPHAGRGIAVGDIDNDGAYDMVVVHQNAPVTVLRNKRPAGNWVRVKLRGTTSNLDAVGAKVKALVGDRRLVRWVRGGGGYLSYFDPRIIIPLGEQDTADVTVRWPSGKTEQFEKLTKGTTHELVEGKGRSSNESKDD
jgi:hypothetical protein